MCATWCALARPDTLIVYDDLMNAIFRARALDLSLRVGSISPISSLQFLIAGRNI